MSRGAGLCRRCGGVKRGRGARTAAPVTQCDECSDPICSKHARWDSSRGEQGAYICTKCERAAKAAGRTQAG